MQPEIKHLEARTVVGMGAPFISVLSPEANNFTVIPALWDRYLERAGEIKHRKNHAHLGSVWPVDAKDATQDGECYYMACAEVTSTDEIPEGFETREIPAGRHAVFIHKGSLDTLGETMAHIYGTWFPESGLEGRSAPDIEVYGERFDPTSEDSELEICIPVV